MIGNEPLNVTVLWETNKDHGFVPVLCCALFTAAIPVSLQPCQLCFSWLTVSALQYYNVEFYCIVQRLHSHTQALDFKYESQ